MLLLLLVETRGTTVGHTVEAVAVAVAVGDMTSAWPKLVALEADAVEESDICLLKGGAAGIILTSSCIIDRVSCIEDETDRILSYPYLSLY